jgi:nucleoside-diphosphate-sugar epimerase
MSKFYLITGGTGFIGSGLVRRLVKEGNRVRVLDNHSRGSTQRLKDVADDVDFVSADIRDIEAVEKAVKGVDSVCHLAFVNGTEFFYSKPELVLDVGVKGIINVLDACVKFNVSELVLASSSEVYQTPPVIPTDEKVPLTIPDPWNPRYSYGAGKIISEIMTLNCGKKYFERVLIFRPHNVYGPDMGREHVIPQFIMRMQKLDREQKTGVLKFPIQGSGQETRAFVFIEDFIDGLVLVLDKGRHLNIYNIGTMEEIRIAEVASLIGKYLKREIELISGESAKGSTLRRCPDTSKLTQLGYQPKFSFEEGLSLTVDWYTQFT